MRYMVLAVLATLCVSAAWAEGESCIIDKVEYKNREMTPDPCDRCWCLNGNIACERSPCPKVMAKKSCAVDGKNYPNGAKTPDQCDRCRCRNGNVKCISEACPQ